MLPSAGSFCRCAFDHHCSRHVVRLVQPRTHTHFRRRAKLGCLAQSLLEQSPQVVGLIDRYHDWRRQRDLLPVGFTQQVTSQGL